MDVVSRLKKYYETNPPRVFFNGLSGSAVMIRSFSEWPESLATENLGITVWRTAIPALDAFGLPDEYLVIDACLDCTGRLNPDSLSLPVDVQQHSFLQIIVYVDPLDCIRMRAIVGLG